MKTIYLECNAGVSGDMILGALTGLLDDPEDFVTMIMSAGIPGIVVTVERKDVMNTAGLKVHISVHGEEEGNHQDCHEHHDLSDVLGIIGRLNVSDRVKKDAASIYDVIAKAESEVHGIPVDLIHFHEVGALDAVADIVGACMLFEKLSPELVVSSPVRTGYGQVRCAHGMLPIPAPATASIIKGIPVYAGDEEGEFCTPTGAAILKHFADRFGTLPAMTFGNIGCGLGERQFRTANMLRAFIGETDDELPVIKEITCNIDDMIPEDLGIIIDTLLGAGALDAFIKPCIMKKGRPGMELTCLCRDEDLRHLAHTILNQTSTIGLRIHECERFAMSSRFETWSTQYGAIRVKVSEGFGIRKWKPEHDDLLRISRENDVPPEEVRKSVTDRLEN